MQTLSDFKRKAEEKKFSFYFTTTELQEEINFLCDTNDEDDRNTEEIIFLSELKSFIMSTSEAGCIQGEQS